MGRLPTELELDITEMGEDGLGRATFNERPYHVRNALPGEQVRARILKRRRGVRYADAVAVVSNTSPLRAEPACRYFPRCSGCAMHHMEYSTSLALKQQHLLTALDSQNVEPLLVTPPSHAATLHYRHKARLGVRMVGEQLLVGFRESFSNRVAKIDSCQTLTQEISSMIPMLKAELAELSCAEKIPQIEVAQGDEGVVLIVRHLQAFRDDDYPKLSALQAALNVVLLVQPGNYESVRGLQGQAVPKLSYQLPQFQLRMRFDPRQFTQVNPEMNQRLVADALASVDVRDKVVADLFCGIGNFSLPLLRQGAEVRGYEADDSAIRQAQANAALNGLDGGRFATRDLYAEPLSLPGVHMLLVDPPRSGLGPQLQGWLDSAAGTLSDIIYVSCNPVSFAADAAKIIARGLSLVTVGVYDMFPYTAHIETLGHFQKA